MTDERPIPHMSDGPFYTLLAALLERAVLLAIAAARDA